MSEIALSPELRSRLATQTEGAVVAADSEVQSLLNFIGRALHDNTIEATKLQALMDMYRAVLADQAQSQYNRSLAAFSAEMPQVERRGIVNLGRDGKGGSYRFAKWEDMDAVLRPIMSKLGFVLSFTSEQKDPTHLTIRGKLRHTAGHSEPAELTLPIEQNAPGRNPIQSLASTLSYGKRYVAEMLLNIVRKDVDDDGKLGGTKGLTPEQIEEIEKLIKEAKADRAVFLHGFFEATDTANLAAEQYVPCRNMLLARIRARTTESKHGD